MNPQEILSHYLKCEKLLSQFFETVGFCRESCLNQEFSRYMHLPGHLGCCNSDYYDMAGMKGPVSELLIQERNNIYAEPCGKSEGECFYHSSDGCRLLTHKSPVCVAFACDSLEKHLERAYRIEYEHAAMREKMTILIRGWMNEEQAEGFEAMLMEFNRIALTCRIGAREPCTLLSQR